MKSVGLRCKSQLLFSLASVLWVVGCDGQQQLPITNTDNTAGVIYHGGDIITMAGESFSQVEAVAEQDGNIVFTGTLTEARQGLSLIHI